MTAVRDPDADHRVRGPFDAYLDHVEPAEVTAILPAARHIDTPALTEVADVVGPSVLTIVDYASIATVGELPLVNEKHGVAWYVGQRGLSYYPLITGLPLSIHSFDWDSTAVKTTPCREAPVSAVVLAACGTACIPIPEHERLPSNIPISYCADPRCWQQPGPTPQVGADQQTEN